MRVKLSGFAAGTGFGLVLSWAQLTDPAVIRNMLLLRDAHVFLIMASAIGVAAIGCWMLRINNARSFISREPILWTAIQPQTRHVTGSVLFGAGWAMAGTCPGPAAAMMGQGNLGGLAVAAGIVAGVMLQPVLVRSRAAADQRATRAAGVVGL